MLFDGHFEAAADAFHRLSSPYDAALALVESGDPKLATRALDVLDRLGADAVAAKVRPTCAPQAFTQFPRPGERRPWPIRQA